MQWNRELALFLKEEIGHGFFGVLGMRAERASGDFAVLKIPNRSSFTQEVRLSHTNNGFPNIT